MKPHSRAPPQVGGWKKGGVRVEEGRRYNSTSTLYVGDNCMHVVMLGGNGTKDIDGHFMLLVPNDERCPEVS